MSRYLILQDGNLSFEEVAQLNVGDVVYENAGYGFILRVKVTSEPVVVTDDEYTKVTFSATTNVLTKGVGLGVDAPTKYLLTKNLMHYGPKLVHSMAIWDREDQCECSMDKYIEYLKTL